MTEPVKMWAVARDSDAVILDIFKAKVAAEASVESHAFVGMPATVKPCEVRIIEDE